MKNISYISLVLFLLYSLASFSQLRIQKPVKTHPRSTGFYFSAGAGRSVLFLERNVKENNDATGYYMNLQYGGSKLMRVSAEFTHYRTADISPTWYNIRASTFETNIHFIARFSSNRAYFYPIFGMSYNMFKGYFTGRNDFLNLKDKYAINSNVTTNWIGFNAGTGFEMYWKKIGFFLDYKMRVGFNNGVEKRLNIMDVCYTFGLKINLVVPSIYSIVTGTRNRYYLKNED